MGAFDHASLQAQAARGNAFLTHFAQQCLPQGRSLEMRGLHQAPLAALDDVEGMHKADLIGIPIRLQSGRIHQGAHGKVGQEQAIEFLFNALRGLRAQGAF